ncbi:hypothetical protein [Marinobacter salicampi]|uniref:hypothetical protein n=1 Tax=Marinobacter salicampi TaxID=435907 RepID=UPI00140E2C0B|nr:hypothetical protein [Marinobacter salicampi]
MNVERFPEELMSEGRKWNSQRLVPEHDELFSSMAPEFIPLTRGWSWLAINKSPFTREVGLLLVSTALWLICAALLYSFLSLIPYPDASGLESRKGLGAIVGGLIMAAFVALINSEIKTHLLEKKAYSRPISERQKLAADVICLALSFRREDLIDQNVLQRALDSGFQASVATQRIDYAHDALVKAAREVAEDLISEEKLRIRRGYVGVAGNERLDLTRLLASLREAANGFSTHIDHLVAAKDLQAIIELRRQELNAAVESQIPAKL